MTEPNLATNRPHPILVPEDLHRGRGAPCPWDRHAATARSRFFAAASASRPLRLTYCPPLERAIEIDPNNSRALTALGRLREAEGQNAQALANFALAMRDSLAEYSAANDVDLQMRIGINSGPVVAGVIGKRRFLYDLWGDSVNTASRMESHGIPGEIQLTEATRDLLDGQFSFIDRGIIDIKGKGTLATYWLESRPASV